MTPSADDLAKPWTFALPTTITFGDGVARNLAAIVAEFGCRPIWVTDRALSHLPVFTGLRELLPEAPVFAEVTPDPTVACVDRLAARIAEGRHDAVVAVGGGSAMDCAKAAAHLAAAGLPGIRPIHSGGVPVGRASLPLIAVPTTAGTGSEVTPIAVLNDEEKSLKGPIAGDALYPARAVVDPELTHALPLKVTTATGLDALAHAIEGYWSRNHQPLCDMLAIEAARLICANLPRVLRAPSDADARRAMSLAATTAGAAFQRPKTAMVHACSYPLSARYHLPHGAACAFTMEEAIRINAPAMGGRMDLFLRGAGLESIEALIEVIRDAKEFAGLPRTLRDAGIAPSDIPRLARESLHPILNNNPRPMTETDLAAMYARLA